MLIRDALSVFVRIGDFPHLLIFENADHPDEYVQVTMTESGHLLAEVGSRQWREPVAPLRDDAVAALAGLGFSGGGPERNHECVTLPVAVNRAASQLASAFDAAYGRAGADVVVKTNAAELRRWLHARGHWVAPPPLPVAGALGLDAVGDN